MPLEARAQVEHVASDAVSQSLDIVVRALFPNARGTSLDPMHLPCTVDSHTKHDRVRPTLVGLVARSIMGKLNVACDRPAGQPLYAGAPAGEEDGAVDVMINYIESGDMDLQEAKVILKEMHPNTVMESRLEFARLVAAMVTMYPERMDMRHDKSTLRRKLLYACTHERFEWYMNPARYRSSLPVKLESFMAVGTTRNENLHARLNAQYRQVVLVSGLRAICGCVWWRAGDLSLIHI